MCFNFILCLLIWIKLFNLGQSLVDRLNISLFYDFRLSFNLRFLNKGSIKEEADFIKGKHLNFVFNIFINSLFKGFDSLENFITDFANIQVKKPFIQDFRINGFKSQDEYFPDEMIDHPIYFSNNFIPTCFKIFGMWYKPLT